ncbi:MAG: RsmE family RNA methyltransferase [Actinomycetes bacterium]
MAGRPNDLDAPWRSAAAQVIVDDLQTPVLSADDLHHLRRVLRLRAGTEICATDGRGGWRSTTFTGDGIDPAGPPVQTVRPVGQLTVAFAPVKGDRPELVVQKLTEIGVDRIVPLATERSVVRWDGDRAIKQMDRLRRVAAEACCQARRLWLPDVGAEGCDDRPVTPSELWGSVGAAGTALAEPGGDPISSSDRTVLVGPEGGWSPAELEAAAAEGIGQRSLGPHVLRAETAAIVAGTQMITLRVDS